MSITFEYVASGLGHSRLFVNKIHTQEKTQEIVQTISSYLNGKNNHKFSILFNAYSESSFPEMISKCLEGKLDSVYSDSGGLQVLTLGKVFTQELKETIYKLQSQCSDIAMSFDEIPISSVKGGKANITSKNDKVFNSSLFETFAEKSRDNLKEQIEIFSKQDSQRAKILPIIQGNSIEGFKQWHKILMSSLTPEELKYCGNGLSFSMASFGIGLKEEISRIIAIEELKGNYKHLHFLGLGSIRRMLPLLILIQNGFLSGIERISYDSTSHTANSSNGTYYLKNMKLVSVARNKFSSLLTTIISDIKENFEGIFSELEKLFEFPINEEMLYFSIGEPTEFKNSKYKNHPYIHACFTFLFMTSQVYNFTYQINKCCSSRKYLKQFIGEFDAPLLSLLDNVYSLKDLGAWEKLHVNFLNKKTKKIKDISNLISIEKEFTMEEFNRQIPFDGKNINPFKNKSFVGVNVNTDSFF